MKKQTYVLFVPGKHGPTVFHNSIETAREEANCIISRSDGTKVMICEFIEGIEKVTTTKPMDGNPLRPRPDGMSRF